MNSVDQLDVRSDKYALVGYNYNKNKNVYLAETCSHKYPKIQWNTFYLFFVF